MQPVGEPAFRHQTRPGSLAAAGNSPSDRPAPEARPPAAAVPEARRGPLGTRMVDLAGESMKAAVRASTGQGGVLQTTKASDLSPEAFPVHHRPRSSASLPVPDCHRITPIIGPQISRGECPKDRGAAPLNQKTCDRRERLSPRP